MAEAAHCSRCGYEAIPPVCTKCGLPFNPPPSPTDAIAAVRARHEEMDGKPYDLGGREPDDWLGIAGVQAHADRATLLAALDAAKAARIQEVASAEGWLAERGYADSRLHSAVAIANLLADYAADVRTKLAAAEAALAAVGALTDATRALMESAEEIAENSYSRFVNGNLTWNDDVWQEADPSGYALYAAAYKALAAVIKATHPGAP